MSHTHTIIIYVHRLTTHGYGANPLFTPLAISPLSFEPSYLLGIPPLRGAVLSTLIPGCSWTELPLPIPPHLTPSQIPTTPGQLCVLLRRHRDPGFTWSGTLQPTAYSLHAEFGYVLWASVQNLVLHCGQQCKICYANMGQSVEFTLTSFGHSALL
jgi:hypothetical protein